MNQLNAEQKQQNNTHIKGAGLLVSAVTLIFLGFTLDGITEYGHHACFILGGMIIGIGLGKLNEKLK